MARTTLVRLTDDIDGSTAVETVRFAADGRSYEIDLSAEHADNLRQSLAQFVAAARSTSRGNGNVAPGRVRPGRPAAADSSAVRAGAKENGVPVSNRGRIPDDVLVQYTSAQQATVAKPATAESGSAESGSAESVADKPKRSRRRRS